MNALKETKKKHLLAILKYLYLHNSSTMNELVGNLQLSQPSIRNMVRILQEKQLIQEVGNDLSSGGRCPTRFALNEKNYLILCLYIQVDKIIYQVRSFSEIKKEDILFYQEEEELKKIIRQLVDKNEVHCCQIAVEGIVYEDEYVTDHQNILKKHHWVKDIKKEIDLPIQLQNDVKMIHQGCYFTYQQDATYYLYINEVGIGSSYFYKDEPLYGNTGIMGEIGLISFKGKTINQRIRECQSQDEFNELLGLLVSMIFTMLDPTRLELSLDLKWNYEEKIIKNILNKIDKNCFKNLYFHKDISSMLFEGLAYRGIVYLLKERIERDEKI
ncbi:ROK family protein [Faecalibacillus intestinalis]|uniref:ROK family protein n=1 Tax=Faecalibacillus intestinalis TaxID=1982626 RepID=UPI00295F2AFD|nr:ROK family protein [Faecalibacillus intestinalis]